MTNNVISLVPAEPAKPVLDQSLVILLTEALERVNAGQTACIAIVEVLHGGAVITDWDGEQGSANDLAAGLMILSHRYGAAIANPDEAT